MIHALTDIDDALTSLGLTLADVWHMQIGSVYASDPPAFTASVQLMSRARFNAIAEGHYVTYPAVVGSFVRAIEVGGVEIRDEQDANPDRRRHWR